MKESLKMCFNWVDVWQRLSRGTPAGRMEFFPSLLTQGEGGVPLLPLSPGRVGFHCSLAGNISSSRMLCLSEACFLFLVLTNTLASIRCAVSLPLLDGPHAPSLFFHRSVVHFFSSPLSPSLPPSLPPSPVPAVIRDLVQ